MARGLPTLRPRTREQEADKALRCPRPPRRRPHETPRAGQHLRRTSRDPAGGKPRRSRYQDRHHLRPDRTVRRRRLQGRSHRQQDRHRHGQREGRRRRPQDHHRRGRRAVQDGRGHQRGRTPAERGQGRPADGRLLERALRADGRQGRRCQEIHVGQRLRRLGGVQGQEPAIRVPPAGALRPVRRGLLRLHRRERQDQARQGGQGHQGRHHPRGRPLRRRRRHGQRGQVQRARHADRAQGGLCRDLRRPFRPRHQAAARAGRRDPAHGLQPRHHAVPAPVQGSGPQVRGHDRPRRRLRPDRQADGDLQGRRGPLLQRRPRRRAAARSPSP